MVGGAQLLKKLELYKKDVYSYVCVGVGARVLMHVGMPKNSTIESYPQPLFFFFSQLVVCSNSLCSS